jgi:hypothetical protein
MVPVLRVLGAAGDTVLRGLRAAAHRRSRRTPRAITHSNHAVTGHGISAAVRAADAAGHHSAAARSQLSHAVAAATGRSVARGLADRRLAASGASISGASASGSWFR